MFRHSLIRHSCFVLRHYPKSLVIISLALTAHAATPTSQPTDLLARIPLGPDTTLVNGPCNPDGTINYVAATNAIGTEALSQSENAAPLFLSVLDRGSGKFDIPLDLYRQLNVTPPAAGAPLFTPIGKWLDAHPEEKEQRTLDQWSDEEFQTEDHPWRAADHHSLAQWLAEQQFALNTVEDASHRNGFYEPILSRENPPTLIDESFSHFDISLSTLVTAFRQHLYLEIGEGQLPAALRDIRSLAHLGAIMSRGPVTIRTLTGEMLYVHAMRAARVVALSDKIATADLDTLADQLPAPFTPHNQNALFERFYALDQIMQILRGDEQKLLRLASAAFKPGARIDEGNLPDADWAVVLQSIQRQSDQLDAAAALPRQRANAAFDDLAAADHADGVPTSFIASDSPLPSGQQAVEAFLKRRPSESIPDYSRRLAKLFAGDAQTRRSVVRLYLRPTAERALTETAIALARYHRQTETWPDSLDQLVPHYFAAVPADPFADQPLRYHRTPDGFLLYSIGLNEKDDGGSHDYKTATDDMIVMPLQPVAN